MKVVLLLCDALRFDRVNLAVMPNLLNLAEKSVFYYMFFADGGATKLSMPYFLCGQRKYDPTSTFPGLLTKAGIHNSLIHSNAVLHTEPEHFEQCFNEYLDTGVEEQPLRVGLRNRLRKTELWKKTRRFRKILNKTLLELPYRRAETILTHAQLKLDERESGFWWVHLMDPHIPYNPPGLTPSQKIEANELYENLLRNIHGKYEFNPEETKRLMALYNSECSYMDTEIHRFIEANLDCLFIITSDHGEMFGETHSYSHGAYYHGMTLQLGHIPFIVYKKDITPRVIFDYHSSLDIGPTILDLFDLNPCFGYGRSMKEDFKL